MRSVIKFTFGLCLAVVAMDATACSCLATDDVEEQFDASALVIAAKPILSSSRPEIMRFHGKHDVQVEIDTVTWRVIASWKGNYKAGDEIRTTTTRWRGGCGMSVKPGTPLILYFDRAPPTSISICERTARYWRFGQEQRMLTRLSRGEAKSSDR
jgi:hypothetical protein